MNRFHGPPPQEKGLAPQPLQVYPVQDYLRGREVTLLKIDTDSVDGEMIDTALRLIEAKETVIQSIVTEFFGGTPDHLRRFHAEGYEIYRLNICDDRRFFDSHGNDIISGFRDIKLEPYLEEYKFQRNMKLLFHIKVKGDMEVYRKVSTPRPGWPEGTIQFLITKVNLYEPAYMHETNRLRPEGVGE
ncbi:hypothetical protein HDU85_000857 [Gaertneriomyces sp. JEL0708]|nr:hypothetical protein HDU85_000857 [Gaertneriomyces sp. JEL0708]